MASSSLANSNSPQTDFTSPTSDSYNTINAPLPSPKMVAPPPLLPFPIFPLTSKVFLSQEVQTWEWSDRDEGKDSQELQLQAKEDAEDEAHNTFIRALSRRKRRRRASQTNFDLGTSTSSMFDSDFEESQSSNSSDSRDDEGEEKEEDEEKKDLAPDYPYGGSTFEADEDAYKLWSP